MSAKKCLDTMYMLYHVVRACVCVCVCVCVASCCTNTIDLEVVCASVVDHPVDVLLFVSMRARGMIPAERCGSIDKDDKHTFMNERIEKISVMQRIIKVVFRLI